MLLPPLAIAFLVYATLWIYSGFLFSASPPSDKPLHTPIKRTLLAITILLLVGFSLYYFNSRSGPPSFPQPPPKAKDFRQIDLALTEPYDFTMMWQGMGEGWIRKKSTEQIDVLAMHVEIKNFAGDTITSESYPLLVHIPPSQAAPIHFHLTKSPDKFGLSGPPQGGMGSPGGHDPKAGTMVLDMVCR